MVDNTVEGVKGQSIRFLHLFTLCSFAFSQPIYDLLATYPEFLISHQSNSLDTILLILLLTVILPLPIVGLAAIARSQGPGRWVYIAIFMGLTTLIFLPVLKLTTNWNDRAVILSALVLAAIGTVSYLKSSTARTFLTLLSPAVVIFPLVFASSSGILLTGSTGADESIKTVEIKSATPVVLVVFDELPLTSLLGSEAQIDPVRYPSFAKLASRSIWFRNATTSAESTLKALPALLTGKYPEGAKVPDSFDYPANIFTLLSASYKMNVLESHTLMCPENLCTNHRQNFTRRFPSLLTDLSVVYLHLILPENITKILPPINQGWKGFAISAGPPKEEPSAIDRIKERVAWASVDKPGQFLAFIESIQPSKKPAFNFVHILLPHVPWEFYPTGLKYNSPIQIPGMVPNSEKWKNDDWAVVQGYQRHLLQVGLVDRLLGQLIAHLERLNLYDSSLIIVLADHGARFWPGESRRDIGSRHPSDILHIPLFVKLPEQHKKVVSNRNVETIDIFPTIMDILDSSIPWPVDGQSVVDPGVKTRDKKRIFTNRSDKKRGDVFRVFPSDLSIDHSSLQRKLALFGPHAGDLFDIGPHRELVGRNVRELDPIESVGMEAVIRNSEVRQSNDMAITPAFVEGSISAKHSFCSPIDLAIAVNGIIRVTTQTYKGNGNVAKFSALLPESALEEGANSIEVYMVSKKHLENSKTSIHLISFRVSNTAYENQNSFSIPYKNQRLKVEPKVVSGAVDQLIIEDGMVKLLGWAADTKELEPAEAIIIMKNDEIVFQARTGQKRVDVASYYSSDRLLAAGWKASFPDNLLGNVDCSTLRVFGISRDGTASELGYYKGYGLRGH